MATEVQNKFVHNGTEYEFAVDTTPVENSVKFITSGAVAEWITSLSDFNGKKVIGGIVQYSTDIPTSGAVFNACAKMNHSTGRLTTDLRHTILKGMYSSETEAKAADKESKTVYVDKNIIYYTCTKNSNGTYSWTKDATEPPQKGVVYYDETTKKFYKWTGSAMAVLPLSYEN